MVPMNQQPKEHTASRGEKVFDWATYGGLAGVGTFVITVPIADWITHGGGAKYYEQAKNWLNTKGLKAIPEKHRGGIAGGLLMTTALMQGGNAMLVPVGIAEKFRDPIVNGINKITGDKTPAEEIQALPDQTALSLIKGRAAAFGAVFAGIVGFNAVLGKSSKVLDAAGKPMARMEIFENAVGRAAAGFMNKPTHEMKMVEGTMKSMPTKTYRYGRTLAVDAFATATAAGLLYVASRFFAKRDHNKEEHTIQNAETSAATDTLEAVQKDTGTPQIMASGPASRISDASLDGRAADTPKLALS